MAAETAGSEIEAAEEESEEHRRGGPGFILGLVMGALTGAAAAALLSPSDADIQDGLAGKGEAPPPVDQSEGVTQGPPTERIREMLNRVRSRMREATEEGQVAAQAAEASSRARYAELTHGQREDYL